MLTRRTTLGFASLAFLTLTVAAKEPGQAFEGKWVLEKSGNVSSIPVPEDLRQQIKQSHSEITIQSQFKEPANGIAPLLYLGIMTTSLRLTPDGQETVNQVGPYALTSKTTINGNTMETDWNSVINGDPVQGHWTRTLSDDGRRMTLKIKESSTKGQGGEATLHFARK